MDNPRRPEDDNRLSSASNPAGGGADDVRAIEVAFRLWLNDILSAGWWAGYPPLYGDGPACTADQRLPRDVVYALARQRRHPLPPQIGPLFDRAAERASEGWLLAIAHPR